MNWNEKRPPIPCRSCSAKIEDGTPYWVVPPLGEVCDACWPNQARNYLREYRNPKSMFDEMARKGLGA